MRMFHQVLISDLFVAILHLEARWFSQASSFSHFAHPLIPEFHEDFIVSLIPLPLLAHWVIPFPKSCEV